MRKAYQILALLLATTFTCRQATAADASIAPWGINGSGQTDVPAGLGPVSQLSAGGSHSLALKTNGSVVAWGENGAGQCNVPSSATNITAIAAGGAISVALRANGSVIAWGSSLGGSPPSGAAGAIAAGAQSHGVAAYSNGLVRSWGMTAYDTANSILSLSNVKSLAAGEEHNVALLNDGTVRAWWARTSTFPPYPPEYVAITNVPTGLTNVATIAAGYRHTLALLSNGAVIAWGLNDSGQTNVPANLSNVVAISAGDVQSHAIATDGSVVTWGSPPVDPVDLSLRVAPDDLQGVVAISTGGNHVLALTTNSAPCITQPPRSRSVPTGWPATLTVTAAGQPPLHYQWQLNNVELPSETDASVTISSLHNTNLGDYRVIVTNVSGGTTSRVATLSSGSVLAWGDNSMEQCWITPAFSNAASLAGGASSTLGVGKDGTVFAAGAMQWPEDWTIMQSISDAREIAPGSHSQLVIRSNQTIVALGDLDKFTTTPLKASNVVAAAPSSVGPAGLALREDGQLIGWGPSSLTNIPTSLTNAVSIKAPRWFALALRNDGTVASFGLFPPTTPTGLSNVVSIDVSSTTPYALRNDGTIITWNSSGVMSAISGATNIVAMSAGVNHLIGLHDDGTVFTAGSTGFGLAPPGNISNVVEVAAGDIHRMMRFGDGSPRITIDPYSRPIHAGGNSTLSAFGVGTPPLSYQWQFNGADISGETNANYLLSGASLASMGGYRCIISNVSGSVTSAVANVSVVFDPPQFELLSPAPMLDTNGFSARVKGLAGAGSAIIFASTNSIDWQPILTNPAGPTFFDFIDPEATNEPTRYYRAVEAR